MNRYELLGLDQDGIRVRIGRTDSLDEATAALAREEDRHPWRDTWIWDHQNQIILGLLVDEDDFGRCYEAVAR